MSKGQINGLLSPMLERVRHKNILPFITGKSVLDLGAGAGYLKILLPQEKRYVGVEIDPDIDKFPDVVILIGDINKELPIQEKFDHVVINEIIEHLDDPESVFKRMKEHLNIDGTIIVSVSIPFRYKLHGVASALGLASKEAEEEHTYFPNKKELYRLAEATGYKIKKYKLTEFYTKQIAVFEKQ